MCGVNDRHKTGRRSFRVEKGSKKGRWNRRDQCNFSTEREAGNLHAISTVRAEIKTDTFGHCESLLESAWRKIIWDFVGRWVLIGF